MHGIIVIEPVVQASGLLLSLSQIVGSYKNIVTKQIRNNQLKEFSWQPSFYDHVVRRDESLNKIREYIRSNPLKWELDRNNPANLWM
jgi:REP element-mobilizing transposase RayT